MLQLKQQNSGSRAEWLVEKRYNFGSGTDNHYKIDGEGVKEIHAALEVNGDEITLFNLEGGNFVRLNDQVIEQSAHVKAGDNFSIGNAIFQVQDPKQHRKAQPVKAETKNWTLKAKNTALTNKSFPLNGKQIIGRSHECDICLNVVHLSRRHAQITVEQDHLLIDDLNSSNGTFVNGKKITSEKVRTGDEIRFDTLKFDVIGPGAAVEKTVTRTNAIDSDATTMRPMITESDIADLQKKPKPKVRKSREDITPKTAATEPYSPPSNETEQTKKTGLLLVGLIVTLIAAAAAYVMFG